VQATRPLCLSFKGRSCFVRLLVIKKSYKDGTDKTWLKKVSEFEGILFPGLEIEVFSRDQKIEAEDWLSSPDDNY